MQISKSREPEGMHQSSCVWGEGWLCAFLPFNLFPPTAFVVSARPPFPPASALDTPPGLASVDLGLDWAQDGPAWLESYIPTSLPQAVLPSWESMDFLLSLEEDQSLNILLGRKEGRFI